MTETPEIDERVTDLIRSSRNAQSWEESDCQDKERLAYWEETENQLARALTTALRSEGTGVTISEHQARVILASIEEHEPIAHCFEYLTDVEELEVALEDALTHEAGTAGEDGA
jgi:hypothetical protein